MTEEQPAKGIVDRATEAAADLVDQASDVGGRIGELGQPIVDRVASAGAAAGRLLAATRRLMPGEVEAARARRLRRLNRVPLANLYDIHPEVRTAPRRELGVMTIPVAAIRGTAVEGPAQRGGDFLPLPALKSVNWEGRWQRLREAQRRLAILPPIDVLQTPEGYWITDGHNRVAAALYGGQDEIDASVVHVHVPGEEQGEPATGTLQGVLEDSRQVRAAGEGRLSRGASIEPLQGRHTKGGSSGR
jgi:hypothetical protein